ncbi:MAG TPA: hypothetical protein VGB64_00260 [Actinomycetota bacterium]
MRRMRMVAVAAVMAMGAGSAVPPVAAEPNGCVATSLGACSFAATGAPVRVAGTCRPIYAGGAGVILVRCGFQVRSGTTVLASCDAEPVCSATSSAAVPAGAILTCVASHNPSFAIAVVCSSGI